MDVRSFEYTVVLKELKKLLKFTSWKSLGSEGQAFLLKIKDIVEESDARLYENSEGKFGQEGSFIEPELP